MAEHTHGVGFSQRSWPVRAQVPTTAAAGTGAPRSQARPAADDRGLGGCGPGAAWLGGGGRESRGASYLLILSTNARRSALGSVAMARARVGL